ncbi:hypothetical protein DEO23_15580 [Brachybacterium endophyticum]|uniref:Uncharacterized protein n=1 Tax=Brachybacterium endophyticum TaxID=2182385 RepID=A0A2U2RGF9_9MICO|nr:hypothetical protein [Brachybacterium endophyticum]PWH04952.1 hypothetical protein DEO23_15580 [Brachybacterium endophyticum]
MSIGYRSILQLKDTADAVRVAEDQMHYWLRSKLKGRTRSIERADWDGPGVHELGDRARLTVLVNTSHDGRLHRELLEFVEGNGQGVWTTRVYAMSDRDARRYRQTMWIESEGRGRNGESILPSPPRIVRNTLETVPAFDGAVPILPEPTMVRGDDVEDLFGHITDQERSLSLVIAAPIPDVGDELWRRAVDSITRETIGCASFFVLDQEAHRILNDHLGAAHSLPLGALRTFVPGVALDDRLDARRHRVLTTKTVVNGLVRTPATSGKSERLIFDERTKRLVSVSPRLQLLEKELPGDLSRATRLLQRQRLVITEEPPAADTVAPSSPVQRPLSQLMPSPAVAQEPVSAPEHASEKIVEPSPVAVPEPRAPLMDRLSALVRRVLGRETLDEQALQALSERFERQEAVVRTAQETTDTLQSANEMLEDKVAELKGHLETERFERAVAESERQDAQRKTRQLEAWRAQRPDHYEFIERPADLWEADPVSVVNIVERLTDEKDFEEVRKYVTLTDWEKTLDRAAEIDVIDRSSLYATAFWEYVLVLMDFAKEVDEHGFRGNVHNYLGAGDRVVGRKCPQARHRPNESESVQNNSRWRKERTFTVPTDLDPSGKLFMTAHFAPTNRDQNAPRLYYTIGKKDGRTHAYIGYIGTHLTNTKTN